MTVKPIPDGYRSVTPYLLVADAGKLLAFLTAAFDARERLRIPRPDGSVMHAEITIGDSVIMVGETTGPAERFGPTRSAIYLYVPDCDAMYDQALLAGGRSVMAVQDIPFNGERYGGIEDPAGNIWWIATHVKDVSLDESLQRLKEQP